MAYLVFDNVGAANAFSAAIDAELGFPRDGVQIGGGLHAPRAAGRTLRYAAVRKHPTLSRWAYPEEPIVIGKRNRVPVPPTATREDLDETWGEGVQRIQFR